MFARVRSCDSAPHSYPSNQVNRRSARNRNLPAVVLARSGWGEDQLTLWPMQAGVEVGAVSERGIQEEDG